jgi:hypothetical protein
MHDEPRHRQEGGGKRPGDRLHWGRGGKDPALQRIMSLVATCAIVLAPALLTGGVLVAPAFSTGGNVSTTSTQTTTTAKTTTATTTTAVSPASVNTTGNGAPSGSHYNLNIIGVPKDKTATLTNNDGHRIFVQLVGGDPAGGVTGISGTFLKDLNKVNKIFLEPAPLGQSFLVLDANATDSNGALFQLPSDVATTWTVWARALGKPGGHADMTTCATVNVTVVDPVTGISTILPEVLCSLDTTLSLTRTKNAKFQNVTSNLLSVTLSTTQLGLTLCPTATVALFDPCLQNFFWNYDNNGLKLLQLRFYPTGGGVTPTP